MTRVVPDLATRLFHDDRGGGLENVMSTSVSWFLMFGVFLMNVQLGQSAHQRDMVDHAASVAADTVTKSLCADAKDFGGAPIGTYGGARERAVTSSVKPMLDLVAPANACQVRVRPAGVNTDPGKREMDVDVRCEIPCKIPFAAQVMCQDGRVTLESKQRAVAMGCDS